MAMTVVLTIGFDPWFFEAQRALWRSAGYFITSAGSIREAIDHVKAGDFDLVLLGNSIAAEDRERLTFLIRASGPQIPVFCIQDSSGVSDAFAEVAVRNEPRRLLQNIGKLLATHGARSAEDRVNLF
jgi:DNA-binding NtrC family response regulator